MSSSFRNRVSVLACLVGLASSPAIADETQSETESKSQSATEPSDGVRAAIEKQLELKLKGTDIPEPLRQKALESWRSQFDQQAAGGRVYSGAVSWSSGQQVAQKKKIRDAIREALEQSGVASEVIEKALGRVDKSLDEHGIQGKFGWRGTEKLPYRIGIGCKAKEADDTAPGLEVEVVFEESPAAKAGLKPGDRLVLVDKQPIRTQEDIVSAVQKAGEENRVIQLEAIRDNVTATYEIKPQQNTVAELSIETFQPGSNAFPLGSNSVFSFPGHAWVMPQWPKGAPPALNPLQLQDQNEKHIDELRGELSSMHRELEEIKVALKKLSEK